MKYQFLLEMFELLDEWTTPTEISDKRYNGAFNYDRAAVKTRDELGRGAFSKVTPDKHDPHMVNKTNIVPLGKNHADKADGFKQFVTLLSDSGMRDNIHFPKVYKANTTTDKTGTHKSSYSLEKLEPIKSVSREELRALEETHMNPGHSEDMELHERIYDACRSATARERYIKLDSLKEACETVMEMDDVSDFRLDINPGNIMVRRTPYGLQLVLSDPFGMIKSYWAHKYN